MSSKRLAVLRLRTSSSVGYLTRAGRLGWPLAKSCPPTRRCDAVLHAGSARRAGRPLPPTPSVSLSAAAGAEAQSQQFVIDTRSPLAPRAKRINRVPVSRERREDPRREFLPAVAHRSSGASGLMPCCTLPCSRVSDGMFPISMAIPEIVGTALSSSSRLPSISGPPSKATPVMFPPGRARLATSPRPTGLVAPEKTMEIVVAVCVAARAAATQRAYPPAGGPARPRGRGVGRGSPPHSGTQRRCAVLST